MPGAETPTAVPISTDPSPGVSTPNPPGSGSREHITSHRLALVLLVKEYCQYKADLALISPTERSSVCLLILSLVQEPDVDLTTMCKKVASQVPHGLASAWAGGVARLQEEGVAGVMDLVQSIEKLLASDIGCSVNRSSVLGLILRRVYLSFDKLTFSEVSTLRQQLDNYYAAGRHALARLLQQQDPAEDSLRPGNMSLECDQSSLDFRLPSFQANVESTGNELQEEIGSVSRKQADLVIAQQASLLQTAESAALPPQELQTEINRILNSCPGLPEAHFLSYLNCLRVRDVSGAEHALYASFAQPGDQTGVKSNQEEISKGFRYAALNLAAFHSRLGHTEEALSAIKEATTMAQEASDHTCLQHVLSLLYRTVDSDQKQRLIDRCIGRCSDLSLSYLASLGIQSFSQLAATSGANPEQVLELLTRSDVLNCQHSIAELQAMSFMCKAAAWSQYGRSGLACTLSQLLLQINTSDPARGGKNYSGESTAIALSNVALRLESTGHPGSADRLLDAAEKLFPSTRSQHNRMVSIGRQRIALWRAIAQLDWTRALKAVEGLLANEAPDAKLLKAELYFKEGRVVESRQLVQEILGGVAEAEVEVRASLLLADIHCWSNDPAGAVDYLVTAAALAKNKKLQLLHVQARLQLAHCQLLLGYYKPSIAHIQSCMPALLAHGSLIDSSRVWLLAAKAKIAASRGAPKAERKAELLNGTTMIARAKEGFSSAGDVVRVKDSLYLLARLYHDLGLHQERNMAAQQYKKLDDLYPAKARVVLDCLL